MLFSDVGNDSEAARQIPLARGIIPTFAAETPLMEVHWEKLRKVTIQRWWNAPSVGWQAVAASMFATTAISRSSHLTHAAHCFDVLRRRVARLTKEFLPASKAERTRAKTVSEPEN